MEKGAAFITAVVTLIAGTFSATLGLGVVTDIMAGFGSGGDSGAEAEFQKFVDKAEAACTEGGTSIGSFNLKSGQKVKIDVSENTAEVSGTSLSHKFSCDITNDEDITYSDSAAYTINSREAGVAFG